MPAQWHSWLDHNWLLVAMALTLALPVLASTWLRFVANRCETYQQRTEWVIDARWISLLMIFVVPLWWSLSILGKEPAESFASFRATPVWALLLIPMPITVFVARLIWYRSDARVFGRQRNSYDIAKLAFWRTVSSTFALSLIAAEVDSIYNRNLFGFTWIIGAGMAALIGKVQLRAAEGFRPRPVKSGELYKRSLVMSKRMGIPIKLVCVVPSGRGRLSNAYGGRRQIAITDDYGHWLHGSQLDYVIAHELAHVKHKDAVRTLVTTAALFTTISAASVVIPQLPVSGKILFSFTVILMPLTLLYALSRRHEYAADRLAVQATKEPEMAIRALLALYRRSEVSAERHVFLEIFSTHPGLWCRINAIAKLGGLSPEHVLQARVSFKEAVAGGRP
jgi:Zn-dependent protease with chaperone function